MSAWSEDVSLFARAIRGRAELGAETASGAHYSQAAAQEIYRNNYRGNLQGALAAAYPVVESLVGTEFFRMMARHFISQYPSRRGNLHCYGAELADFVRSYAPARALAYLADVASLEWASHLAYFAQDTDMLDVARLANVRPEDFTALRLLLHPACRLVKSEFPIVSIWQAHQTEMPSDFRIDLDLGPEHAWVCRQDLQVGVHRLNPAEADWLEHIMSGAPLGTALATTLAGHPDFDLQAALTRLVSLDALIDFELTAPPQEDK